MGDQDSILEACRVFARFNVVGPTDGKKLVGEIASVID